MQTTVISTTVIT